MYSKFNLRSLGKNVMFMLQMLYRSPWNPAHSPFLFRNALTSMLPSQIKTYYYTSHLVI